ncbi:hypothetical protein [Stenotrophomonas sp. NLF4-10]|uniref:hypothetical protein n=1 Tax=Stenotrophomonas sp. NLF4-10 TaxID=2918754 RepID=UPI001EFAA212|nr:hypothetical protein [Stenotrophomonas sp. NLF4-10]MCG8275266.1 hypothetical protein [Stenotrophomonas sp. NLF4-10]
MKFISLRVRNGLTIHGYTDDNIEIVEEHDDQEFVEKLISLSRIQSATEKYLLVTSSHDRVMYWEYDMTLSQLTDKLARAGFVVA